MSRPNKNLRVKSFVTTRNSDGSWIDSYVFSDGSAWTESMCNGWACQWAPIDSRNDEPEESSKALTAKKANSIAEARLSQCNDTLLATARLWDEYRDRAERAESALAEAKQENDRLKKEADEELTELARKELDDKLANAGVDLAAKEPEPLDPMRVLATAAKRLDDRRSPGIAPYWNHVMRDAISLLRANSGDAKPYPLRSESDG